MKTVLIIEPSVTLSSTYRSALEGEGYKVYIASGAQQALELIDDNLPDTVVLELQLVGANGVEFLHEFRSYEEWRKIPIIINTHLLLRDSEGVAEALMRDFNVDTILYKPTTSLQKLLRVIKEQVKVGKTS